MTNLGENSIDYLIVVVGSSYEPPLCVSLYSVHFMYIYKNLL